MSVINATKEVLKRTGLHRPLRKLVSSTYRQEVALTGRLIEDMQRRGFEQIRQRHNGSRDNSRKYLDLGCHVPEAVRNARNLELLDSKPLRVLDIGCGSGYFLFTLKSTGHDVVGLDLSDDPLYNDTVRLLGIPRVVHRVEKLQRLPDFGEPFDLITAFSICFDLHSTKDVWGQKEWKFFLDDCRSRLNPGGRIFLNFNPASTADFDFIPDPVAEMLRAMPEGRLTASKEFFTLRTSERRQPAGATEWVNASLASR